MKHENLNLPASILVKHQTKIIEKRIKYDNIDSDIVITIRHDDNCGNGHNSFSITGDIYKHGDRSNSAYLTGGCIHNEIIKYAPELQKYIKWHLCTVEEPLYYIENTLYHASKNAEEGLNFARSSAIWFEAKPEDFTNEKLLNRLPKLMNDFKEVIESLGFTY